MGNWASATVIVDAAGSGKVPPVLPLAVARMVSRVGEVVAGWSGKPPLIPEGQLHFLEWRAHPSSEHAGRELGWKPTAVPTALSATIDFLRG